MTTKDIERILTDGVSSITSLGTSEIAPDAPLHTLGIDSLGFVELLVFIEKKFNLKLIESGLSKEDFQTIKSLATRISRSIGQDS